MIPSISREAERELIDGALFYTREANVELGLAFIGEFERSLRVVCNYPQLGPVWRGTMRRFPLRRFPYSIVYQIKSDEVRVIALAHQSRKPGYWPAAGDGAPTGVTKLMPDHPFPVDRPPRAFGLGGGSRSNLCR